MHIAPQKPQNPNESIAKFNISNMKNQRSDKTYFMVHHQ